MRALRPWAAASVALLVLAAMPGPALAAWSPPERISALPLITPALAVDAAGHRHVAARGADGVWYLTDRSGHWRATRLTRDGPLVDGERITAHHPDVDVDPVDGRVVVAWIRSAPSGTGGCDSRVRYRTFHEGVWSRVHAVPTITCAGPLGVEMRDGRLTVAAALTRIEYWRLEIVAGRPGAWTSTLLGDENTSPDPYPMPFARQPSLELDGRGRPSLAYEKGVYLGDSVRLAVRWAHAVGGGGAGLVSDPVKRYAGEVVGADAIDLVLDATGRPRIAWVAFDGVIVARKGTTDWTLERVADRVTDLSIAVDAAGRTALALARGAAGLTILRQMPGGDWAAVTLDDTRVDVAGGLVLDARGKLHVAWQRGPAFGVHAHVWVARAG